MSSNCVRGSLKALAPLLILLIGRILLRACRRRYGYVFMIDDYVFIPHFRAQREALVPDFSHDHERTSRLMCTLCSTPTRPFVGPSRLLAGPGSSARTAPIGATGRGGPARPRRGAAGRGQRRARSRAAQPAWQRRWKAPASGSWSARVAAEPTPDTVRSLLPGDERRDRSGRGSRRRKCPGRREAGVDRARQPPRPHRRADPHGGHRARPADHRRTDDGRHGRGGRPRSPCCGTTAASGCSCTPISSRASC